MTRVIKVGGRPQADPSLAPRLARAWSASPTVLVHGGGGEITQLQAALGLAARFVDGRRITTAADIDVVRMVLSGTANKRLVSTLVTCGVPAIGLSGEDGTLIAARAADPARLGRVGTPVGINVDLLRLLLSGGYLPVVSPVSRELVTGNGTESSPSGLLAADQSANHETSARGAPRRSPALTSGESPALNVNADDAAAAIAVAVGAEEFLLISDVEGVYRGDAVVARLTEDELGPLTSGPEVNGGMRAKLQAAGDALRGGVPRVRISDLAAIDDPERGTLLVRGGGE